MHRDSAYDRFLQLQQLLTTHAQDERLDRPLKTWVAAGDRHLPQRILPRTLRDVLTASSWEQLEGTRGVGRGRLEKLLCLLERAARVITHAGERPLPQDVQPTVAGDQPGAAEISEVEWSRWCDVVRWQRLGAEPLGRFARSLADLPAGVWFVPLDEYVSQPLHDVREMPGYGPARVSAVLDTVARVARAVGAPRESGLAVCPVPANVRAASCWVHDALRAGVAPDDDAIRRCFLAPLLDQLETDVGAEVVAMVRRRIGTDGPGETLKQIAGDVGLTRERVRQLTERAAEALRVRWPEGRFLLDDFYDLFQSAPDAQGRVEFVRAALDALFAVEFTRGHSRGEVLAAWEKAGRAKRTPMGEGELKAWLAVEFPHVSPELAFGWLAEDGLRDDSGGTVRYYSTDPLDRLLLHLHRTREPVHLIEAAEVAGLDDRDERNLSNRLDRDPRFIEDEYRRVAASEDGSFFRAGGEWRVRLRPGPAARADSLPVPSLAHLIVGGLLRAGVADATVWGVYRFADDLLAAAYGGRLPDGVTPFVLAGMLVRLSDGLFRPMRRRRLRWDTATGDPPVRGKRGWMSHVVGRAGTPITFEELRAGMREFHQDYEDYVYAQMTFDGEDDAGAVTFRVTPGVSTRVPRLYVPDNWQLNAERSNVSDGVRRFAARVVASRGEARYARSEFDQMAWVVPLCEHAAYGAMAWADHAPARAPEVEAAEDPSPPPPPERRPDAGHLADLVSRFL